MTTMKHRTLFVLLMAASTLGVVELPTVASAQDVAVTGPLAGQPPVRHLRQYRRNRISISPFAGFTLQQPYRRSLFLGGHVDYHFTDWLGVGVWGAYGGLTFDTALTDAIVAEGITTNTNQLSFPSRAGFRNQLGSIPYAAMGQITLVPLRGKVAIFQRLFLDTDLYIFGGAGIVGITERADISASTCANPPMGTTTQCLIDSQSKQNTRIAVAPTFGVGFNAYFNSWMGISVEWRALPFSWNRTGTDEAGAGGTFPDGAINSHDRFFYLNHMFTFGFTFMLPGQTHVSR